MRVLVIGASFGGLTAANRLLNITNNEASSNNKAEKNESGSDQAGKEKTTGKSYKQRTM